MQVEQEKIYVRFNVSGRKLWWETMATHVFDVQRDSANITVLVLTDVLYGKCEDDEEVIATVTVVADMAVKHLCSRRRKVSGSR